MAFIKTPGILDRQIHAFHRVKSDPQSVDGAAQNARVSDIEVVAFGLKQLSGFAGFFLTLLGQIDIGPTGEAVFQIPLAFAVTHQYKLKHKVNLYRN